MQQRQCRQKKKQLECKLPSARKTELQRERREQTRRRVAKCRMLKQQRASQIKSPRFSSAKALGKALSRARRAMESGLPKSPRRRQVVCRELFHRLQTPDTSTSSPVVAENHKAQIGLSLETTSAVKTFYERDDISMQTPGIKNVMTIRFDSGMKQKMQTRYLTSSVMEVYSLFKKENPSVKVGKSKFAELRPKHVLLNSKVPQNICLCKYHENFISAVDILHKNCPAVPSYSHDLPEKLICTPASEQCWFNQCDKCKYGNGLRNICNMQEDTDQLITWYVWKNDGDGRLTKVVEEGSASDLVTYLCSITPQFLEHCYVKRHQADMYKKQREAAETSWSEEAALLQVDFSENYTCMYQDEIQSAHWQQSQVSLFTAAIWYAGKLHPTVIVTDNTIHAKETVVAYIRKLLLLVKARAPASLKTVHIWSDGPASQFKNRYIAAALVTLQKMTGLQIQWNFFATSHGKGPVDGIGGSVKRHVWLAVKSRKHVVTNASTFLTACRGTNVDVIYMTDDDIREQNNLMNTDEVFTGAEPIKGIAHMHQFRVSNGMIEALQLSSDVVGSGSQLIQSVHSDNTCLPETCDHSEFVVGDWCAVEYDKTLFPGEIRSLQGDDYEVSVMVKAGKYWKWPQVEDKIFYQKQNVRKKLNAPKVVSSRGHFVFDDF